MPCRTGVRAANRSACVRQFEVYIYLFIHYATEAAHITLQTYKIKHKVKTQSTKNKIMSYLL